jgi:hypothetical protein
LKTFAPGAIAQRTGYRGARYLLNFIAHGIGGAKLRHKKGTRPEGRALIRTRSPRVARQPSTTKMPIITKKRAQQASEVIAVLADLWPAAFSVFEGRRKPLKVGIDRDIIEAANGAITTTELRLGLSYYVGNAGYLSACTEGVDRINLYGEPAGRVSHEEATHSAEVLARRQRERAKKAPAPTPAPSPTPSATTSGPRRSSLADLRTAAAARKGAA